MNRTTTVLLSAALALAPLHRAAAAQSEAAHLAAVDGLYDDWSRTPAASDPEGDAAADGSVDFGRVWVRSDAERVTLRFEVGTEMSLQGGNAVTLFLDGDGDAATGHAVEGLGAELAWTFGQRTGTVWSGGEEVVVQQADIGMRQAPTVSSTQFEVSFLRRTTGGIPIAPGPRASLVLVDEAFPDGDRLPNGSSALGFALSDERPPERDPVTLERRDPTDIRVVTWNVLFDGLFKRPAPFIRVLRALDPDIICFQELWAHTARQAADQVSLALPGSRWYAAASAEGHVVSRYPITLERPIDESGNYWVLVDLPDDRYSVDMSVVSAHPPCCDKEEARQRELDGIAAWMRELVTPGGALEPAGGPPLEFDLPEGTPIVIAGDMNLVGGARQVRTLTDGDIADEKTFGPSRPVDWDGTPLADARPRVAGDGGVFTWRDSRSSFSPGRLDYVVYSDSVLELRRAFVLETSELTAEELARYGLRPDDTLEASDHLPVVADFAPIPAGAPARTGEAGR